MTVCDDLKLVEEYLKDLDNITADYLREIANEYLDISHASISVLMPEK